ncbi:hypothetical protein MUN81_14110 [Hymenobacter sp. 5317J-9]|uniref:hypothetical protein n=1 Tax=Hymenobacter sp. 5317J-9 TaxID=2932250 RepID=UPI001FD65151|nr:hypothetical protein [Hymenobacter sp. 5317J-9]UOQ96379.1 hypothetical protein MUN81_14110 [Hymenobacter sp. 5317J-9]
MHNTSTLLRRLLPALLLGSLALAACEHRKDCDPRPKNKCGSTQTSSGTKPGGNS